MEQEAGSRLKHARHAVVATPGTIVAAEDRACGAVLHEARHKQIKFAVVIVIEPRRAGGPVRSPDSSLVGYIRERAVPIIVEENVATVVRDVQILPSVAVKIGCGGAHSEMPQSAARDSCL